MQGAMLCQKHYHDLKVKWDRYDKGDLVYVFCPQKKIGRSPKLMSIFQGAFQVVSKISDVIYKVSNEDGKKTHIIYVD